MYMYKTLSLSLSLSLYIYFFLSLSMAMQSRRIIAKVAPIPNSGNGPLVCVSISMSKHSIYLLSWYNEPLDSYQEQDLER